MFQDLNRKLQHTVEKEKEALGADGKVGARGGAPGRVAPRTSAVPRPARPGGGGRGRPGGPGGGVQAGPGPLDSRPLPAGPSAQQPEKQQTPNKRPWESLRKAHGAPAWGKELEPLPPPAPLELRSVEWEKAGATIPLVGQDIIDLQTEV